MSNPQAETMSDDLSHIYRNLVGPILANENLDPKVVQFMDAVLQENRRLNDQITAIRKTLIAIGEGRGWGDGGPDMERIKNGS